MQEALIVARATDKFARMRIAQASDLAILAQLAWPCTTRERSLSKQTPFLRRP